MKYNLLEHPKTDLIVAVKIGFSWPAFFFNFIWMLIKGLWVYAGSYLMIGIILSNIEKVVGKNNSLILDVFILISYVAMILVPGFMGNKWCEERLEEQGYKRVDSWSPEKTMKQTLKKFIVVLTTSNQSEMIAAKSILESEGVPFQFSGGELNTMGLLSSPAKLRVPIQQKENALLLLKQLDELG